MSRHFIFRAASFGALATALLFVSTASQAAAPAAPAAPGAAAAPVAPDPCDRACLRQALDAYLAGVFKHDPGAASLSDNHFATENSREIHNGEGFWKNVSGYGDIQRRWFDPYNRTAAFCGLLKKGDEYQMVSVRIRVEGRKVSEAEWIYSVPAPGAAPATAAASATSGGQQLAPDNDTQSMVKAPPPEGALPVSERSSRFMLIAIANNYFQSVAEHDATWFPQDPACKVAGGITAPRRGDICHENFQVFKFVTKDLALRRIPVVDEEAGVVLGIAIFQRYPGLNRPDTLVHEYFLVRKGVITDMWTARFNLPFRGPVTTGWENR